MLQMFTTQLFGKFKEIKTDNEEKFEDCARVLAQALTGDGKLFLHGFEEMAGVFYEATDGKETLPDIFPLITNGTVAAWQAYDRILIFTRFSTDTKACSLVRELTDQGATVVVITTVMQSEEPCITSYTDFCIDLNMAAPLIPGEDGQRIGYPSLLVALYAYHGLIFTIQEFLEEYE